jgi:hypothetical protein
MQRVYVTLALVVGLLSLSGCSQQPQQPAYKLVSTVEDLMEGIVIPASDRVFQVGATSVTKDGIFESVPKDDEEWSLVKHSAMVLAEAGNLLQFEARAQEADWKNFAHALTEHATGIAAKAEAKDKDAVFNAAAAMYTQTCQACHAKYLPQEEAAAVR